jgi:hypothetical protein
VRQKGHRGCYGDVNAADMAAGYVNNDHDDNHDGPRQGNTYYRSSSRSAERDSRPKTEWHWCRDQPPPSTEELLNRGCPKHTYLNKDGRQNRHILSSSAGNFFDPVKHFRRRCGQNSPLQVL